MFFVRKKNGTKVYGPIPIEKITHGLTNKKLSSDDYYAKTKQGPWNLLSDLDDNYEEDVFFNSIKSQAEIIKTQKQTNSPLRDKKHSPKPSASKQSFSFPDLKVIGLTQDILTIYIVSFIPWIPLYFIFPQVWPLFALFGILLILSFFQFVLLYAVSDSLILMAVLGVIFAVGNGVTLCLTLLSFYEQHLYGFSIIPTSAFWLALFWQIIACGLAVKRLVDDAVPVLWSTFFNWVAQLVLVLCIIFFIMPIQSSYLMYLFSGLPVYLSGDEIFAEDGLNINRIERNEQLPPNLDASSLAKIFTGTWVISPKAGVAPVSDTETNSFEINFSFGPLKYNHGYYKYAEQKTAASLLQNYPGRLGEWKIRSVRRCYDGSYHMNLSQEGKDGSLTLPVQNLTRNAFTVDIDRYPNGRITLFGVKK